MPTRFKMHAAAGAIRTFLDSVKVVHNDLSDADVEVVPMKSRAARATSIPELPPPSRPWDYLAERMFHATRD